MSAVTLAERAGGERARALTLERCGLLSLNGPRKGEEVFVDRECFRIGKSPDNDLVLADATVSREHCELIRDSRGYLLRDLGSTNGTLLDGAVIREGYLSAGAVISVGRVELKVRPFAERIDVLPSERESFGELHGQHPTMREIFGLLERLAPSDATLLIGGETGTGKDLLARAAHAASPRAQGPFVVVDCGAVVSSLIESELFGHEKGAFTGASDARKGAFELAHKGSLFLDEIGELPLSMQPKLLRALETRRIRRVGGEREMPVDIRVIAATHRDLKREVERGHFREDLYFRLAVVPLELPPLRERRVDIPLIAHALLSQLAGANGAADSNGASQQLALTPETVQALQAHDWPGNVRELRNVLERSALMARAAGEHEVRVRGLPVQATPLAADSTKIAAEAFDPAKSYRDTRVTWELDFERRYVTWLLERHQGNLSSAARAADMDRKYLHKLAKKHGLRGD
jgi:transcriptional regulator with GAF, ATPase, and Fis domain